MEVLFLALSACCVAGQFVLSKCYQQKYVRSVGDLLLFPALTAVPAGLYMFALNGFALSWHPFSSPLALCFALIQTLSLLANVLVVRCGPLSVFSVFMMLGGMLLPYAYGAAFLQESVTPARIVGLILLLAALALSCLPGRGDKKAARERTARSGRGRGLFLGLCAAAFVLNGATSVLFKVHSGRADALSPYGFQAWGFVFQLVLSLVAFLLFMRLRRRSEKGGGKSCCSSEPGPGTDGREAGEGKEPLRPETAALEAGEGKEPLRPETAALETGNGEEPSCPEQRNGAGDKEEGTASSPKRRACSFALAAGYAVVSSSGGSLNLLAARSLPASMQYPFLTGGSVLLTTLASVLFFGEKFTPRTALLLVCLLAGTVLFLF